MARMTKAARSRAAKKGWRNRTRRPNPSKRKTRKRISTAFKKFMKAGGLKNPGRKVKGGRAVSLRGFTGTVTRKANGQVVIRGRSR